MKTYNIDHNSISDSKHIFKEGDFYVVSFDNIAAHVAELHPNPFQISRQEIEFLGERVTEYVIINTSVYVSQRYWIFAKVKNNIDGIICLYDTINNLELVREVEKILKEEVFDVDIDFHIYLIGKPVLIDVIQAWLSHGFGKPVFIKEMLRVIKESVVVPRDNEYEFWLGGLDTKNGPRISGVEYDLGGTTVPLVSIINDSQICLPGLADIENIDPTRVKLWSEQDNKK